jgi:solute:Na+ symporter, SSS family
VGFLCSVFVSDVLTPQWASAFFGLAQPLDSAAREYWTQGIQFFANVVIGSAWFMASKLWWNRTSPEYKRQIESFFVTLNTPVDFAKEQGASSANDARQQSVIGWLSLAYGAFVVLLALIPNSLAGRLSFVGCGGIVVVIGVLLLAAARKHPSRPDEPPTQAHPAATEPRLAPVSGGTHP